jgi:conserved hypothethical protein
MTETPAQMLRSRQKMLSTIQSILESKEQAEPKTQPAEHLLELAVGKLVERERLPSFEGPKDQFTSKPLGNETAVADAFGLTYFGDQEDESAHVDIFVVDPYIPSNVTELSPQRLLSIFRKAFEFINCLKCGILETEVPEEHPSKKAEHAVYEAVCSGLAREWRIWIVTASVWKTVGEKTLPVPENELPDAAIEVLDLDFFRMDEDAGISQKFNPPGLPCIAFEKPKERGYSCYLTAVTGDILADLYHKHGTGLIEENVRSYLGYNTVNKQVRETIKNNPECFLAYNNGLVISAGKVVCQDSNSGNGKILEIGQMQIINGGQTTVTIYRSLYNTTKAKQSAMRKTLENLWVPVKIVVPDEDLDDLERRSMRDKISRAANSQTAVKSSDLSANEPFQIEFAKIVQSLKTPEDNYWFYDRAKRLYDTELSRKKYSEKTEWQRNHPAEKVFDKTDLSSSWLAWNDFPIFCAQGKETAFKHFRENFLDDENGMPQTQYGTLDIESVKKMICQLFIMRELENTIKSSAMPKEQRVQNPHVPVIYAIYLFAKTFGAYIDWQVIWERQRTPQQMLTFLQDVTRRVDSILREDMGTVMIAMWGRKSACRDSLLKRFTFKGIEFDPTMVGLNLPSSFELE